MYWNVSSLCFSFNCGWQAIDCTSISSYSVFQHHSFNDTYSEWSENQYQICCFQGRNTASVTSPQESPTTTALSSSPLSSPSTSSTDTPIPVSKRNTQKPVRPQETKTQHPVSNDSYSADTASNGIKSAVPSRDYRSRGPNGTPTSSMSPAVAPQTLPRAVKPSNPGLKGDNIMIRDGPKEPTVYSTSETIPEVRINNNCSVSSMGSVPSTNTLGSNCDTRRRPFSCCHTM